MFLPVPRFVTRILEWQFFWGNSDVIEYEPFAIRFYRKRLKPLLGRSARNAVYTALEKVLFLRISPFVTRIVGPQFTRSRDLVEIDITYLCNLNCFNCNRSCEQQPTNDHMSLEQIHHFLEESRARGMKWKRIRVVGGEPTTHPKFLEVLDMLLDYRARYWPRLRIELVTNGHGSYVNKMIAKIPAGIVVNNTAKQSKVQQEFHTFNVAPIDEREYDGVEFANACPITSQCGMGVTPYGYYPCTVAGAIDRTFGFNMGRKVLPDSNDGMQNELRKFCSLCGHFKRQRTPPVDGPIQSPVWRVAYERSRKEPPQLSRLPEWHEPA